MNNNGATAGIIVIGDEILKGQIQDTNSHFLAKELKSCGIKLQKMLILPDDIDEISSEVRKFCSHFTYVFTCGGVGPTHDDVTFEAVAKAFNEELVINEDIKKVLQMHFKDLNESMLKMAKVPKSAKADYSKTGTNCFPVMTLNNLFILPGIPSLLEKTFACIKPEIRQENSTKVSEVYIKSTEFSITEQLNELVSKHKNSAVFGSYPSWNHNYYGTKLTIEALKQDLVDEIVEEIHSKMDVIEFDPQPLTNPLPKMDIFKAKLQDQDFKQRLEQAQKVIEDCYEKYDENQVAIAFNGGKDCMVLLHLTHIFLKGHKLKALYIRDSDPFPIVEDFIAECQKSYDLDLTTIQGSMKDALQQMLDSNPQIKAILMGTRTGDPGSKGQGHFSPTDGNWPLVMRVNPIIDWHYQDVWKFLRGLFLPYPILYDQGYTSLGGKSNTSPNPHLATSEKTFKPAYFLEDGTLERAGRQSRK